MSSEFALIARHFTVPAPGAVLGVGDDAALLAGLPGMEWAVSTDMLVEGTHFLAGTDPRRLGHKCLAVNLSDLAAMGARARHALLALALPQADDAWVAAFSAGFLGHARAHGVDLVGGDTTRGPLTVCVTVLGTVPAGCALRRDGARAGDRVWVSGTLGDAALGLRVARDGVALAGAAHCLDRLECPQPRLGLGQALVGLASAAIDVSDGLVADLGHIGERSGLGARIDWERVPLSAVARAVPLPWQQAAALAGGDDYELCFTAPASADAALEALAARLGVPLTAIGHMVPGAGVQVFAAGAPLALARGGYDHFG